MKTIPKYLAFSLVVIIIVNISCKKSHEQDPCQGLTKPTGKFVFKELIGDTAFVTDTAFRDNYVQMKALDTYEAVSWTLGGDPRTFTQPEFSLSFINLLGTIPVSFTGNKTPNTACFTVDNGIYTSTKNLTTVEQVEKPNVTISPLVGRYKGYFTNNPSDTFTVRMEYFDSAKYDIPITGSKNFYWLSNIPKGYVGTATASFVYKELQNGLTVEMGYKCFVFGTGASIVQGKGWLSNDSIYINYGSDLVGRKKFIGKKF
jgi:hypothetical protein